MMEVHDYKLEDMSDLSKFNITEQVETILDKFRKSDKKTYYEFRLALAKEMVEKYNLKEIKYTPPKAEGKRGNLSHGIDKCDYCDRQTHQTVMKDGWHCDRCKRNTD